MKKRLLTIRPSFAFSALCSACGRDAGRANGANDHEPRRHAAIWIDHTEARIFHLHRAATDETTVLTPQHDVHRHQKGRGEAREHPDDAHRFFADVARTLGDVAILIVGPSSAKFELFKHLHAHDRILESKVIGLESADHPTDGQIVAQAKSYFTASDRMGQDPNHS